jgi:hypothetical protein
VKRSDAKERPAALSDIHGHGGEGAKGFGVVAQGRGIRVAGGRIRRQRGEGNDVVWR